MNPFLAGSLITGISSIFSGKSAAKAQDKASDAALAAQTDQYNQSRSDQITGVNRAVNSINAGANSAVNYLMGGADESIDALRNGQSQQWGVANTALNQQRNILTPTIQDGNAARNALMFNLGFGPKPKAYRGFDKTPGYDFRFDEGMRALEGSAAASGNLLSGATLKDAASFGTGLADQSYDNYINQLFGMTGVGQNAGSQLVGSIGTRAANVSNAAANTSNGIANILGQQGANLANVRSGQGSARAGAFSGLGTNLSGLSQGYGSAQAQAAYNTGNAKAAGAVATGNAINAGVGNYLQGNMFNQLMQGGYMNPGAA